MKCYIVESESECAITKLNSYMWNVFVTIACQRVALHMFWVMKG